MNILPFTIANTNDLPRRAGVCGGVAAACIGTYMVRPHIASALFVLTREALQPYIRPLDCRVLSLRAPMDSAPW